jgi:hypothetical protein
MLSGWILFPLMIWAVDRSDTKTDAFEDTNEVDVYVLIYTVIAAVLVFGDLVGRY